MSKKKHVSLAEEPQAKPVDRPLNMNETFGSMTGEIENAPQIGGWAGTDDATSTAPSDLSKEQQPNPHKILGLATDPTGRATGGDLMSREGGIADITGSPVEDTQDWSDTPINALLEEELDHKAS